MIGDVAPVLEYLDANRGRALERLFRILAIPSISTDPNHADACRQAALWCAEQLKDIGFTAEIKKTRGHPMVIGRHEPDIGVEPRRVLFYGHYDVQPVEPLAQWRTPPFEPRLVKHPKYGQVIVARGASDDKGQFMTFLEAARAWFQVYGKLPLAVTVLLEGEEEIGSPNLPAFLADHKEDFQADLALVCDTVQWDARTPAITSMLRGLAHVELRLTGPRHDLHSGMYGGPAMNPLRVLCQILGDLHNPNGRIMIPGFYDAVREPSLDILNSWRALGWEDGRFLGEVGLSHPAGETGRSIPEQLWSRPTAEINGISGGYAGPGIKTIIPAEARAKLSFRLVPDQDPEKVLAGFREFVHDRLPPDIKAEFLEEGGAPAVAFDTETLPFQNAAKALEQEFGRPPVFLGCGASVPVVASFHSLLGMDTLAIGFALDDDAMHSPNEKYNVTSFVHGARAWARIIGELSL